MRADLLNPADPFILAIDVGNTRTKCGLLEMTPVGLPVCRQTVVAGGDDGTPWQDVFTWPHAGRHDSLPAIIAGSHPERIRQIVDSWPEKGPLSPKIIESAADIPLTVDLPEPGRVGVDRLLNSVAANRLRPDGRPAIIVDCGTATTVDVVSAEGLFMGGAILPGLELSARALNRYTARLPLVDVVDLAQSLLRALGRNTQEAIRSGLFWGQVGAVRELVSRFTEEFANPLVLITGGGGESLLPYLENVRYEPHLSLQGLALVMADCE